MAYTMNQTHNDEKNDNHHPEILVIQRIYRPCLWNTKTQRDYHIFTYFTNTHSRLNTRTHTMTRTKRQKHTKYTLTTNQYTYNDTYTETHTITHA